MYVVLFKPRQAVLFLFIPISYVVMKGTQYVLYKLPATPRPDPSQS